MADGRIAFDSRINTDNLEKDLSKMEESISQQVRRKKNLNNHLTA